MSRSEFHPDDSSPDPTRILEQHLLAGFSPDLALDLVLNELVVRAAEATRASGAALALVRGDEMVCRAATGHLAPDLGVALNTRDGLSGACLQTRQPQLSVDTEFDPRVDPAISRRRGIRSILIVPVFDSNDKNARFTGVLEVFSTSPAAFSHNHQKVLEAFAEECARIRQAAIELSQRKPAAAVASPELVPPALIPSDFVPPEFTPPDFIAPSPLPPRRSPYEAWTLVLGSLAILATIAVSFLIGSRIGWLSPSASHTQMSQPIPANSAPAEPIKSAAGGTKSAATKSTAAAKTPPASAKSAAPAQDELVVYEKGKVIFRMKPAPSKPDRAKHRQANPDSTRQDSDSIVEASSTTKIAPTKIAPTKIAPAQSVWLAPAQSEARLLSRTEPLYPPEALAAHRAGTVVLEVQVAEDGSVSNIRTLSGDPVLAAAAAEAVRNWRYQPYRQHDHPAQFQTDVTLTFALPN
ncbi:MAG: TonB family protein [Terriglobales bacterium]